MNKMGIGTADTPTREMMQRDEIIKDFANRIKSLDDRFKEIPNENFVQTRYTDKDDVVHDTLKKNNDNWRIYNGVIYYLTGIEKKIPDKVEDPAIYEVEDPAIYEVHLEGQNPRELTLLILEEELERLYGKLEKRNGTLRYREGVTLSQKGLSHLMGEKFPKNIERLIEELRRLKE